MVLALYKRLQRVCEGCFTWKSGTTLFMKRNIENSVCDATKIIDCIDVTYLLGECTLKNVENNEIRKCLDRLPLGRRFEVKVFEDQI